MTALDPVAKERWRRARSRAGHIRFGMQTMDDTFEHIARARAEGDHLTLGYETWDAYVNAEFGAERVKLPVEKRNEFIDLLALAGASQREIARTVGVSQPTVQRALASGDSNESPGEDEGAGQAVVDAVKQAIVNAGERAEDHRADTGVPEPDRLQYGPASEAGAGNLQPAPAQDHRTSPSGEATGSAPVAAGTSGTTDVPATDPGLAGPADSEPASSSSESDPYAAGGEPEEVSVGASVGTSSGLQLPDPDDLPESLDPAAVERYRQKLAASQRADYLLAFAKAMEKAGKFLAFSAEQVAEDPAQVESVRELLDSTQRFYDRMVKSRTGLRLLAGGRS